MFICVCLDSQADFKWSKIIVLFFNLFHTVPLMHSMMVLNNELLEMHILEQKYWCLEKL